MNFFDKWARHIAAGDWLTDQAFHPHHNWHQQLAETYLRTHPQEAANLTQQATMEGEDGSPARILWNRWYGGKRFHQEPLYPYLIAATYRLLGPSVFWVFGWQMFIGVLGNVLIYLVSRRYFGDTTALVAGCLAVLCAPLLYYEVILLRATLVSFMGIALVHATDTAIRREKWMWWALTGLVCGLAFLLKTTLVLFFLGLIFFLVLRYRSRPDSLRTSVGALIAVFVICLTPAIARNIAVGVPPMQLSSVGALGVICAHAEDTASKTAPGAISRHTVEILSRTGGRFLPTVIETLKTNDSASMYLGSLAAKFMAIWHWYEVPNNANFYYYQLHSVVLRSMPVTFLVVASLALPGLVLSGRQSRTVWPLYLLIFSGVAPLVLFGVLSRYRTPLLPVLIPFAALTLVQFLDRVRAKRVLAAGSILAAVGLLSVLMGRPLHPHFPVIRADDYIQPYRFYYEPLIQKAAQSGDWERAADIASEPLRYEPQVIRQMDESHFARTRTESTLGRFYAYVRYRYADLLAKAGRHDAERRERRRAQQLVQASQVRR